MTDGKRACRWGAQADQNIDKWGDQSPATLLLAMVEELGEIADELDHQTDYPDDADPEATKAKHILREMAALGELTRAYLESNFEADGAPKPESDREAFRSQLAGPIADADPVQDELDDLMPLGFQLARALENEQLTTD